MANDLITFDFDNDREFSDDLPQGTYPGTIEHAEVTLRRDDGSTAAQRIVLKIALRDIPEWGDVTRTVRVNIPDKDEDNQRNIAFFGRQLQTLTRACGISGIQGRTWGELAEMLIGCECSWNVQAPREGRNGGTFQNINAV